MLAPDLPGHGKSSSLDYSWTGMSNEIKTLLSRSEWENTTLVLHSFSAAMLPEITANGLGPYRVYLIEGALCLNTSSWTHRIPTLELNQYASWVERFKAVAEISLRLQLVRRPTGEELEYWGRGFKQVNPLALRTISTNLNKRLGSVEFIDSLRNLAEKIVYIRGSASRARCETTEVLKTLKISTEILPCAGHFPMIDNPTGLSEVISRY